MSGTGGWVKLHRSILKKDWLTSHRLFTFWCWCLLKASHKEHALMVGFQEITLQPGQFIFGRQKAARDLGMSERNVRTCLYSLTKLGNVTNKVTNKFSIITVVNWAIYQGRDDDDDQQTDQPVTSNRPQTRREKKGKEKTFPPDAPAYRLAAHLFDCIIDNNHTHRLAAQNTGRRETTIQRWALDIDKLIRIDGQNDRHIGDVITWAAYHPFWAANIQSGAKLRERWDVLAAQMKQGK